MKLELDDDDLNQPNSNSCKICGDRARVINYGALSCQSCKTFFRRNGFRPENVRPCSQNGQCEVDLDTRKVCSACRLAKCFAVGMRSDRIRKEDFYSKGSLLPTKTKRKHASKRKKLILKIRLPTLDLLENNRSSLTSSDWTLFSNVIHAYDRFSLTPTLDRTLKNLSRSSPNILGIVGDFYAATRSFISSAPDFQVLTVNEQQSLVKRNFLGISTLSSNILFRDTHFLENPICSNNFIQIYGHESVKQIKYIMRQFDFDTTLLKLMLFIISFSSNCMVVNLDKNFRNDSFTLGTFRLYGSQNVYVELLWKYMLYRYGYDETVIRFSNLVRCVLLKIRQTSGIYMNNAILHDYANELAEKTKETLVISQSEPSPLWGKAITSS